MSQDSSAAFRAASLVRVQFHRSQTCAVPSDSPNGREPTNTDGPPESGRRESPHPSASRSLGNPRSQDCISISFASLPSFIRKPVVDAVHSHVFRVVVCRRVFLVQLGVSLLDSLYCRPLEVFDIPPGFLDHRFLDGLLSEKHERRELAELMFTQAVFIDGALLEMPDLDAPLHKVVIKLEYPAHFARDVARNLIIEYGRPMVAPPRIALIEKLSGAGKPLFYLVWAGIRSLSVAAAVIDRLRLASLRALAGHRHGVELRFVEHAAQTAQR